MIDYKGLGERIRKNRKRCKLTQADLAEKAELSTEYLSEIENNHKQVSLSALTRLSDILGVTLDELLYGETNRENIVRQVARILEDCSEYELKVLCKNLNELKQILRDNVDLR